MFFVLICKPEHRKHGKEQIHSQSVDILRTNKENALAGKRSKKVIRHCMQKEQLQNKFYAKNDKEPTPKHFEP